MHRRGMAGDPLRPLLLLHLRGWSLSECCLICDHPPSFLLDGSAGRIKTEEEDGRPHARASVPRRCAASADGAGRRSECIIFTARVVCARPFVSSLGRSAGRCGGVGRGGSDVSASGRRLDRGTAPSYQWGRMPLRRGEPSKD